MDVIMNKNTDSNINSEKVYSIHSISNGNISAPIILEQNNDVILPPQNLVSELVNLYNKGKVFQAIQKGQYLSNKYPDSFMDNPTLH